MAEVNCHRNPALENGKQGLEMLQFVIEFLAELGINLFVATAMSDGDESAKSAQRFAIGCAVLIALGIVIWLVLSRV